jgi:hypothetical protein
MTWWAAVLGFVGALAGSWGGQLIATRREDRRWQREREREDLRHEREIERLRLQHTREVELAWRSERLAAYARLLTALLAFESKAYAPVENPAIVHDTAEREEVRRIHKELHNTYTLVLVGSGSAVDRAGRQMIRLCKRIARWYDEPQDPPANNEQPDFEGLLRAFSDTFEELTEACRNELDLGPQAPPPESFRPPTGTESAN